MTPGDYFQQERRLGKGSGVAFAWQDKKALDAIRNGFDGSSLGMAALAVYVALTELASDNESQSFVETLGRISEKSGASVATVKRVLPVLEMLRVVEIVRHPGLRLPSTYVLTGLNRIAQTEPTIAQTEPTIAQGRNKRVCATSEEDNKKKGEEREKGNDNGIAGALPSRQPIAQTEPPRSSNHPHGSDLSLNRTQQRIWESLCKLVPDAQLNVAWWERCILDDSIFFEECLHELRKRILSQSPEIENRGGWLTQVWKQRGGEAVREFLTENEVEPGNQIDPGF
jgi:hypothetical protein